MKNFENKLSDYIDFCNSVLKEKYRIDKSSERDTNPYREHLNQKISDGETSIEVESTYCTDNNPHVFNIF